MKKKKYICNLCKEVRNGNNDAFNELVNIYYEDIIRTLERYNYSSEEIGLGYNALYKTALLYNENIYTNFIVILINYIKKEIVNYSRYERDTIINHKYKTLYLKILKYISKYKKLYNESPTIEEISSVFNVNIDFINKLFNSKRNNNLVYRQSLNEYSFDDEFCDKEYYKLLYDELENLKTINRRDLEIVKQVYGYYGENQSYEKAGKNNNVKHRQQVARIIDKVIFACNISSLKHSYNDPEYVKLLK